MATEPPVFATLGHGLDDWDQGFPYFADVAGAGFVILSSVSLYSVTLSSVTLYYNMTSVTLFSVSLSSDSCGACAECRCPCRQVSVWYGSNQFET